jgi:NTF2 fold immunity protein
MHRHTFNLGAFLLMFSLCASAQQSITHSATRPQGYVPDAATAITIAVAVLEPIYGRERISRQKPFKATLVDGIWTVEGSLPKQYDKGGVAVAEISKEDGRILRVSHGK